MAELANHPLAFDLQYMHQVLPDSVYRCFERRTVRVVLFRVSPNRMLGETEDTFSVALAETGETWGWGDTKAEAANDAILRLMDRSRREYRATH